MLRRKSSIQTQLDHFLKDVIRSLEMLEKVYSLSFALLLRY